MWRPLVVPSAQKLLNLFHPISFLFDFLYPALLPVRLYVLKGGSESIEDAVQHYVMQVSKHVTFYLQWLVLFLMQ
jgi:hypothetical protein